MPIREYAAVDAEKSCLYCRDGFDVVEEISTPAKQSCPNAVKLLDGSFRRRI